MTEKESSNPRQTRSFTLTSEELQDIVRSAVAGAVTQVTTTLAPSQPAPTQSAPAPSSLAQRPSRPSLDVSRNETHWAFFLNEWQLYKRRAQLPASDPQELRACCSEELKMELFDFVGTRIDELTEGELLVQIKKVAVRGKNVAVHRQEFYTMQQEPGQPIQHFVAQLKAKAEHCQFHLACSSERCTHTTNSYSASMVADQMIVGLYNKDIQGEVLAKHAQLATFDEKYNLIQALEDGQRAKEQLRGETSIATQRSTYKRKGKLQNKTSGPSGCPGCGSKEHGPGTDKPRNKHCPARNISCDHCHIRGHMSSVCRKRTSATAPSDSFSVTGDTPTGISSSSSHGDSSLPSSSSWLLTTHAEEKANRIFSSRVKTTNRQAWKSSGRLARSSTVHTRVILPHMEWSEDRFVSRRPHPLPTMPIRVEIVKEAHAQFKRPVSDTKRLRVQQHTGVTALADSGAQTCACGVDVIRELGLDDSDLVPTSHRILGVTLTALDIIGVFFAKLSIPSSQACTRQMIYVSRNTKGFFLSHKALQELGFLPPRFPIQQPEKPCSKAATMSTDTAPCGCPHRMPPPPMPDAIPFEPQEENVIKLERWILDRYKGSAFNTCEHQALPCMTGKPMQIHFRPEATPKAFHRPIPVPHHWKTKVKADIDRDVRLGIIEPVPPGTPTVWCSRMVVVPKKDGSARRTVDLQHLNAATYRATHHTPSPFNQASLVPPNTRKTILDAWNGYHSLQLSPEVRDATTFITEWGRYRYLRAPQGFHAAGDAYTKSFDDITVDVERKTKCIDDTILWDKDIASSFWHTVKYITLCSQNGVVFNPKKFQFGRNEVDFAGFTISNDGLKPTASIIDAIKNFPTPQNLTDARSWFGLVNQVAYNISSSSIMQPFRELLKPGKWYWDDALDTAFNNSKLAIISMIQDGVRSFEPNRPTCLATDWSKEGLGFILLQKHCRCPMTDAPNCCPGGWRLIFAGSRFTTEAESRYAPVEGEALAVTYALEKCRMFTLGCSDLTIATDHKPLVKILGDSSLDSIKNPRLFNLKEKTLPYRYTIKHVPGTWHKAPDACSRQPNRKPDSLLSTLNACTRTDITDVDATSSQATFAFTESLIQAAVSGSHALHDNGLQAITLERIKEAATSDPECISLTQLVENGFPSDISSLDMRMQSYWKIRDGLSNQDGITLYEGRVVIPAALRKEVLECLHSAHQGVAGMKARAQTSVYWPGLNHAISNRRAQCAVCNRIAPSQPMEPLRPSPAPTYPFELVVADYFTLKGVVYLVYADRYTGWVTVAKCSPHGADSSNLKRELRSLFCVYGAPRELATDGGQPFASHSIQNFLQDWGVHWRLSSAYYPQSNGRAELAVKTTKRILQENTAPNGDIRTDHAARALLQYHNTPLADLNTSPAQLLYGRVLRDHLPSIPDALRIRPEWQLLAEDREKALAKRHLRDMERYNEHTRSLPELSIGDTVAVQNQTGSHPNRWDKTGTITEAMGNRQYMVRLHGSGRCTLRNRRFMRRILPVCTDLPQHLPQPISPPADDSHPISTTPNHDKRQPDIRDPGSPSSADIPTEPHVDPTPPTLAVDSNTPPATPPNPMPRRSTRVRRPRRDLSPCFRGKWHEVNCRPSYVKASAQVDIGTGKGGKGGCLIPRSNPFTRTHDTC